MTIETLDAINEALDARHDVALTPEEIQATQRARVSEDTEDDDLEAF